MLKFFKKIRLEGIQKGSIRKYLLYAIGEIILVVIGILLALQVNNMSQNAQKNKEERKALLKYQRDLERDIDQLIFLEEVTNRKMMGIDSLFKMLNNPGMFSIENLMHFNLQIPYVEYFEANRGTFEEGIASGKISFIRTDSLREEIFDYYRFAQQNRTDVSYVKFMEDILTPQWGEIVIPTREGLNFLGLDNQMVSTSIDDLSSNKKYIHLIAQKYATNQIQIQDWHITKLRAIKLKNAVMAELE